MINKFKTIRRLSELITSPLGPEANNLQANVLVSPNKWHLAHTTWFFEQFILKNDKTYKEFNPKFNYLFNSYYNTQGKQFNKSSRHLISDPDLNQVMDYRNHVNSKIEEILSNDDSRELIFLITLGLNHEQQHQELILADTKYNLFHNPTYPQFLPEINTEAKEDELTFHKIPEGIYSIGYEGDEFFFDNEKAVHKRYLHSYEIASRPITNGEYLNFINDGAYENPLLWHSEAWTWIKENKVKNPLYWIKEEEAYFEFNLKGGKSPLKLNNLVSHLSYYEAWAFAKWFGGRLAKEFEWEAASKYLNKDKEIKETQLFDLNSKLEAQSNTESFLSGVWEWTESAYLPYPMYKQDDGYLGEYNGKFMINQMVLKGACSFTPFSHSRATYRNFYYPSNRWQQSGIRIAKDSKENK